MKLFLSLSLLLLTPATALRPREEAPGFEAKSVQNDEFVDFRLSDWDAKWKILVFYPFDFTFVCPTELVAFSEAIDDFRAMNCEVAAISTDSHHTHLAWSRTPREDGGVGRLKIPLVADISKSISEDYGVLVNDTSDELYGAALRGLFIIDGSGKVRSVQINDEQVGRNVEETKRILQGFQYADSHAGEGCPANWVPGAATIKADPDGAKEYFKLWGVDES